MHGESITPDGIQCPTAYLASSNLLHPLPSYVLRVDPVVGAFSRLAGPESSGPKPHSLRLVPFDRSTSSPEPNSHSYTSLSPGLTSVRDPTQHPASSADRSTTCRRPSRWRPHSPSPPTPATPHQRRAHPAGPLSDGRLREKHRRQRRNLRAPHAKPKKHGYHRRHCRDGVLRGSYEADTHQSSGDDTEDFLLPAASKRALDCCLKVITGFGLLGLAVASLRFDSQIQG